MSLLLNFMLKEYMDVVV